MDTFDENKLGMLPSVAMGGFNRKNFAALPAEAMRGLGADQLNQIVPDLFEVISPLQVEALQPTAIDGMTSKQLKKLSPDAFEIFDKDILTNFKYSWANGVTVGQLRTLDRKERKLLPGDFLKGLSKPQLKILKIKPKSLTGLMHSHQFDHLHGNDSTATPLMHEHDYSHSHISYGTGDHKHSSDYNLSNISYEPIHNDGTHP